MRIAFAGLAVISACASHAGTSAPTPVTATQAAAPPREARASAVDAKTAPKPRSPKVVLHLGDSMVDPYHGLGKALGPKFEALASRYYSDSEQSVGIAFYDHERRIDDLIAQHSPDLVLVTLGANDIGVPFPEALATNVQSIVKRVSAHGRACYWLLPPLWKKDTGIVDVIRRNASPCKVFDPTHLKIERRHDGIHPDDAGGATWAEAFFAYYEGIGPATPNEPTSIAAR